MSRLALIVFGLLLPAGAIAEPGLPSASRQNLQARGHRFSDRIAVHGGYQAIWREEKPQRYFGGSDPRKDGGAFGY